MMTNNEFEKYILDMIPDEETAKYIAKKGTKNENNKEKILNFIKENNIQSCKNMFEGEEDYENYEKIILFTISL